MTELIVAEEHSQLYELWRARGSSRLALCHVDFHCDMRGLLIDRRRGRARSVWQSDPSMNRLDSGSFLAHAVMEGIVTSLRWVHDDFGGRRFDDLYCVKYESDFSALPFRLPGCGGWVPLSFAEQTFAEWGGPRPGEQLCIDWDGIAYIDYQPRRIRRLMAEVLERECQPELVFVARSPDYCHRDPGLFAEFVAGLEKKFQTTAVRLPFQGHPPLQRSAAWSLYHRIEHGVLRQMRRLGIY